MKKRLDESLFHINFDGQMQNNVIERINSLEEEAGKKGTDAGNDMKKQGKRAWAPARRRFTLAAAASLCIVLLAGVCFAAELPQRLISKMGLVLEPVNQVCVFDGIELNVLGAAMDQDSAEVHFTLRDLEGSRISESTSVYDFRLSDFGVVGCIKDGYDPETGTASFYLEGDGRAGMAGKKLGLSITSLVDGASDMGLFPSDMLPSAILAEQGQDALATAFLNPSDVENAPEYWICQNESALPYQESEAYLEERPLLPVGSMDFKIPGIDWLTVTNMGYENGWLHIQAKSDLAGKGLNYGYLCLLNANGSEAPNAILNKPYIDPQQELEEFIIYVGPLENLSGMKLGGSFTSIQSQLEGNWNAVFRLEKTPVKMLEASIQNSQGTVNQICLSSIGVTLYGIPGQGKNPADGHQVSIRLKNGRLIEADSTRSISTDNTAYCKYRPLQYFDIEEAAAVIVDGQEFPINE